MAAANGRTRTLLQYATHTLTHTHTYTHTHAYTRTYTHTHTHTHAQLNTEAPPFIALAAATAAAATANGRAMTGWAAVAAKKGAAEAPQGIDLDPIYEVRKEKEKYAGSKNHSPHD